MKAKVPRLPVAVRQGGDEALAQVVEVAGAPVVDLLVLLEDLLGRLIADLLLVAGAGGREQAARLGGLRRQQRQGGEAGPGQRRLPQKAAARLVVFPMGYDMGGFLK